MKFWLPILMGLLLCAGCGSGDEPEAEKPKEEVEERTTDLPETQPRREVVPTDPLAELRAQAGSSDEEERMVAANALGEVDAEDQKPKAGEILIGMLEDESVDVRQVVAEALGNLGATRLDALRSRLKREEETMVRRSLIEAIYKIGGSEAIPDLKMIAADDLADDRLRTWAITALGDLRATGAVSIFKEAAEDIAPEVRLAGVIALGKLEVASAIDIIGERMRDASSAVQLEAARALGKIGDRNCVKWLVLGLDVEDPELLDVVVPALAEITGEKKGYVKDKGLEENATAIEAWQKWWEEKKRFY
jgi:hypothetical protein